MLYKCQEIALKIDNHTHVQEYIDNWYTDKYCSQAGQV